MFQQSTIFSSHSEVSLSWSNQTGHIIHCCAAIADRKTAPFQPMVKFAFWLKGSTCYWERGRPARTACLIRSSDHLMADPDATMFALSAQCGRGRPRSSIKLFRKLQVTTTEPHSPCHYSQASPILLMLCRRPLITMISHKNPPPARAARTPKAFASRSWPAVGMIPSCRV